MGINFHGAQTFVHLENIIFRKNLLNTFVFEVIRLLVCATKYKSMKLSIKEIKLLKLATYSIAGP